MKQIVALFLCVLCLLSLVSCDAGQVGGDGVEITDDLGTSVTLGRDARVVCCYGSFAECWLLSGGTLVGVTDDAISEGRIESTEGIEIVGSVKEIDLERLVRISPDYVILSADLVAHTRLRENLLSLGIAHGFFRVDTFSDYARMMERFCAVSGRSDLYEKNVTEVAQRIERIKSEIPDDCKKSVLLMRAYSTGVKAKTDDNLAGLILRELGLVNIASETPSLLEDMSVEHIVARDPDFIFVLTMGSEESALAYLADNVENNPAWSGLSAVRGGRYFVLPKELFHYKPNERWAESYEYLAKIVFPEIFS